jgi:GSCFA family
MDLMLKYEPKKNEQCIQHTDKVMLIGSCFTEHIGNFLQEHKLTVLQNPNGILFDTWSVCRSLTSYIEHKKYTAKDLFFHNELWQSWQHHGMFSGTNVDAVLQHINTSQAAAAKFITETNWLIITLGSSFAYTLNATAPKEVQLATMVANCHKAPQQWFTKYLIPIEEQIAGLDNIIYRIKQVNPNIKIIFTISPVRHIRDGVVENNRSKARLLETVHHLVSKFSGLYYFSAYELLMDVLRDYRFYDVDMVHPNYTATNFVIQHFLQSFIDSSAQQLIERIKPIIIAKKHRAFNPDSIAHKKFMLQNVDAIQALLREYPHLNFDKELDYFSNVVV